MGTLKRARRSGSRGQSVVEFALVLPIMVVLLFAIVDFARIFTTMVNVESAAREAADYGTTLGAGHWQIGAPMDDNVAEMRKRACVASSNLPDYVGIDADSDGIDEDCSNPSFDYCVTAPPSTTCGPVNAADACDDPLRATPCTVTVTLSYDFHMLAPMHIELMGVEYGLPSVINFDRDSTFAMTDIDVAGP
jgi:TadE-like protein